MDTPIFLIGYRAVGKTTVGKKLADRLVCSFLDTDQMISLRKGGSIRSIVDKEGWEEFRRLEKQVLTEFAHGNNCVVATGGGAIMHREQWRELRQNSLVVWLTASAETLIDRLRQDANTTECRPSLTGKESMTEVYDLLAEREPLYQESAHLTIDTERYTIDEAVDIIFSSYNQMQETGAR